MFLALPAGLFGFLVEARTRLALSRAWLWLARQPAPAFDGATAERDQLRAARHAVTLALPGHRSPARALVVRELTAGRLPPIQPDTTPDASPDEKADAGPGGKADGLPDTHPDGWPDTAARPSRGSGTGKALRVAEGRREDPA